MDSLLKVNDGIYYYFLIGGLFLSYLIYRIINSVFGDNNYIQTNLRLRGHSWRSIECNKSLPYNIYCTVCGKLMLPLVGLFCECCALSACKRCHGAIGKKIRCKPITWPTDKPFYHHWVNVGIPRGDDSIDNIEDCIKKFFCSWCQRTKICPENSLNESEVCDFQKYKNIIIPPPCVQVEKGEIRSIKPLQDKNWEPLIIFANRKSGSNRSDEVLSIFKGLLNPIQVVDISSTPPESVLKWLPSRCRVLVAGGDGTVAWILNTLLMTSHVKAAVGILPMGTGNDLSRVLGWGATCGSHLDAHSIVTSLRHAQEQPLDSLVFQMEDHYKAKAPPVGSVTTGPGALCLQLRQHRRGRTSSPRFPSRSHTVPL
ncbi:diacylglycerol kinase epsilon isoform X3 [Amyelois transitella]|uniref:diacylglycerol kinase epsilon isoform X3 n=1 Tax=Amyelois transitella TaxID=680683 RepID=UPI00298FFEBC|nr:diacylglycerol kinase epsilon isoform X3 [Amyelois transitella]